MNQVMWDALTPEQQRQLYPQLIRQVFAHDGPLSEPEVRAILPPLSAPESVQIEITTWCNLKCRECGRTKLMAEGKWVNGHISLDTYRTILEKLPPAQRISLQGVGEPTIHPEFVELVRLAVESRKYPRIAFVTNGLTHKDEYWAGLGRDYGNYLEPTLSIDSLDPVVAERCRAGTDVELLFHRLQLFRQVLPNIGIGLVASKLNLEDIAATFEKIARLGPGKMHINYVITDDESVALDAEAERVLRQIIAATTAAYPNFLIHGNELSTGLKRCIRPFLAPFITFDGFLTPCCALTDPTQFKQTSLLEHDDWNGVRSSEGVMDWMRSYVVQDPPPCRGCPFNPVHTESSRAFVKRDATA